MKKKESFRHETWEIEPEEYLKMNFKNKKIAILKAQFNEDITDNMLKRAVMILDTAKISYEVFEVSGSFELIYGLTNLLEKNKFDGYVPLGCIIKGETTHFENISENVASAIKDLTIKYNKPIGFGVLTCLNEMQANERTSLGSEATIAVLNNLAKFN